ncbi:hypothetical protein RintRC_3976 [Richelia intracellularis]|nr:hypothetical protein RintRC_3976 [Richelia intracellularis]
MRDDFTKFSTISQWFQTLIHPALMQRQKIKWQKNRGNLFPRKKIKCCHNHTKLSSRNI